jgi:alpha-L-fucosidase
LLAAGVGGLQQYQPNWPSLDSRPLPSWYDEAKVGIFIHWGLFSVPSYGGRKSGCEWFWENWVGRKDPWIVQFMQRNYLNTFTYPDFGPQFKAELFDPQKWVDLFERAGAKYIVLTSKHHEGWANWPSNEAWNWNSVDSGPQRDLVGELANATRSNSPMRFGVYFSLFEWFHPLFLSDMANHYHTQRYVSEVAMPQLYDLVSSYQPHLIWCDGDWDGNSSYWNTTNFLAWLYNDSPVRSEVVVNDRWGSDCSCTHGGYFTCRNWRKDMSLHSHKWESYYSVMEGSWGYCRDHDIHRYRNISIIISELVTAVRY